MTPSVVTRHAPPARGRLVERRPRLCQSALYNTLCKGNVITSMVLIVQICLQLAQRPLTWLLVCWWAWEGLLGGHSSVTQVSPSVDLVGETGHSVGSSSSFF